MKSIFVFIILISASVSARALDIDDFQAVYCELKDYGQSVTVPLDFDPDADPGEEWTYKIGQVETVVDGDIVSIYATVSEQPLFFVQIETPRGIQEVEVGADSVDFISVGGGSAKANGICYFR